MIVRGSAGPRNVPTSESVHRRWRGMHRSGIKRSGMTIGVPERMKCPELKGIDQKRTFRSPREEELAFGIAVDVSYCSKKTFDSLRTGRVPGAEKCDLVFGVVNCQDSHHTG